MQIDLMHLKILIPFKIFFDSTSISRIVAETTYGGSFGLLPHRLDCVAALSPGILTYKIESQAEDSYVAIDEGILIKTGAEVLVSVRRALGGASLAELRATMEKDFINIEERERNVRFALKKMESAFIHRFVEFQHD